MKNTKLILSRPEKAIDTKIDIPGSKSESNRALILQHLCLGHIQLDNLSTSDDTLTMEHYLKVIDNYSGSGIPLIVDVGNAGTVARFLTAYLANTTGHWLLTGDESMRVRPMHPLVDALRKLGAKIEYTGEEGCLPIRIIGTKLEGGCVEIDSSVSSQFVSALLLIAAVLPKGIQLKLKGNRVSAPYIKMTLEIMKHFGIKHQINGDIIQVPNQMIRPNKLKIGGDWSSASYWYEIAALAPNSSITLTGLKENSHQGDKVIIDIFKKFSIQSDFTENGLVLRHMNEESGDYQKDFTHFPDLAQTCLTTFAGLGKTGMFSGLQTLHNKETDRIAALNIELRKIGVELVEKEEGICEIYTQIDKNASPEFDTHNDHRMAMCLAPLCLIYDQVVINDPEVVAKSYPRFWKDLEIAGFRINFVEKAIQANQNEFV